jgi:hypothetical protein
MIFEINIPLAYDIVVTRSEVISTLIF